MSDPHAKRHIGRLVVLLILVLVVGAAIGAHLQRFISKNLLMMTVSDSPAAFADVRRGGRPAGKTPALGLGEKGLADKAGPGELPEAAPGLKLVYNAEMSVAVDRDAAEAYPAGLTRRVMDLGGYISDSYTSQQSGERPSGQITVRIPSKHLAELMDWVGKGAAVLYRHLAVRDITEQYVDLEARLANLTATETRLTELLAKATGKLDEVLAVERELRRVRREIEQIEGRKRLWDHQVAMSTLKVHYEVARIYRETAPAAETFGERLRAALVASWDIFVAGMATAAVAVVYAWPWLVVLVIVLAVVLALRRARRHGRAS